ncbi:alpha/beta hydrolase [Streptomyces sp. XM4193]|uniref:alpha/beta fold hydrolase n=1 Tax=Streptomyces sp. XM4193 TaxID=2929782 RepID=UPI001FF88729|nr:alpha/beta hydrolase [Streptomyces sp. XM4193]MCK1796065.1 alpha/beta hydrolase [Streptomyces sp. XM4193]
MDSTGLPVPTVETAAGLPSRGESRLRAGETRRTVQLPGCTMAVRSRENADRTLPPALYVHGLGGSSQNWSALMAELAGTVDGEAVDLPGFGDSPPPQDGNYGLSAHARAVIRHLDAAGRGPVHLFGNSMGGAAATRVAALRPDLVRTLTLVSPALPELRPQRSALPTALLAVPGTVRLFRRLTGHWSPADRTRAVLGLCYGDPSRVASEDFEAAVEEYQRRLLLPYFWDSLAASARGVVDSYTLGGQHALWRQAGRVLAPTLLVYGGRDKLVGFRMARKACRVFRDSRLLALPDAGHVAMMEYPELVAGAFRQLMADSERAGVEATRGTP